ncbi:MAG: TIGR04283 family arsenosugar biosynthesis glycosyltransferase [Candidatus Omnitrophica bacterium]|nr:TIGR04283 family arsenosugar biosynthesis glycosyltransferase [Candidatus Omnitrophota bacterium]
MRARLLLISVVVPVRNEAAALPRLLPLLLCDGVEVILADGGSTDSTVAAAKRFPVRLILSGPGRASQINAGAAAAAGEILWFLHADTVPPPDWRGRILQALSDPRTVGGGFRVLIDAAGLRYRLLDAWGWFRTNLERTFYGDQGIFVRRSAFEALGGFTDCAFLEDLDFSTRLSRQGRVAILPQPLKTSARRWQREGWGRTVWEQSRWVALYHLGRVNLEVLQRIVLVIVAKVPIPGRVKTRLCPPLSPEKAAGLARRLLEETVALAQGLDGAKAAVAVFPPDQIEAMRRIVSSSVTLLPQEGKEFGQRLERIFQRLFAQGAKGVIALGADHPGLPREFLVQAVEALQRQRQPDPLVIGPTEDGGYYLIGLNRPHPELFKGIPWSTSAVLEKTLERAGGLKVIRLPPWFDVDRPEDLARLKSLS